MQSTLAPVQFAAPRRSDVAPMALERVLRTLRGLQSRRMMIQSLMSAHEVEAWVKWLKPLDAVVVLSEQTRGRLLAAGMPTDRVVRIYPGVAAAKADPAAEIAKRWRLLYAGDLDTTVAARLIEVAQALPAMGWRMTIACRPKGAEDAAARGCRKIRGPDVSRGGGRRFPCSLRPRP